MKYIDRLLGLLPRWGNTLTVTCAIVYLTLVRDPVPEPIKVSMFPGADKVVHGIMFAALAFMLLTDIGKCRRMWLRALVAAAAAAAAGGIIEVLQHVMALGRSAEWADFYADAAGAAAGACLAAWRLQVAGKREHEA